MILHVETIVSEGLIGAAKFDLLAYLRIEFCKTAQAEEAFPENGFSYPLESYRCLEITGPHDSGASFRAPPAGAKVYMARVERLEPT
jgi:hypothetical protein